VSQETSKGAIFGHLGHLAEAEFLAVEMPYLLDCIGSYQVVLSSRKVFDSKQAIQKRRRDEILKLYNSQQRAYSIGHIIKLEDKTPRLYN
jgi:hypothetical protein